MSKLRELIERDKRIPVSVASHVALRDYLEDHAEAIADLIDASVREKSTRLLSDHHPISMALSKLKDE
jgi:hypothetical protein